VSDFTLAQWLRKQPDFVAGTELLPRLKFPTAADFNVLKADLNQPQLGLASTRQLLEELESRGRIGVIAGEDVKDHEHLNADAKHLLQCMPDLVLNYRTVDE
jgi:hypothetical protein